MCTVGYLFQFRLIRLRLTVLKKDFLKIIILEDVEQIYPNCVALEKINLTIYQGEIVGLIGSSGAGKSTIINLINGTLLASKGKVLVFNKNIAQLSPQQLRKIQRKIGTIYQQFHLVENLKVIHNINAGKLSHWSFFQALISLIYPLEVKSVKKILTQLGIPEKIYTPTYQLSGGQKQRVALGRVLRQNPEIILADEPIASLDPKLSRKILNLLHHISKKDNKTLIMSLHSVELARQYCDRLIGLRTGKILFDLPVRDISNEMIKCLYER